MSITLKGSEIVQLANMPKNNVLVTEKYSAKLTYDILKALKLIKKEAQTIEETRIKLAGEFGKLNEETNQYEFADNGAESFVKVYSELLESEFTIEGIIKFNPTILKNLSVTEYEIILPLLNDFEECEVLEIVE